MITKDTTLREVISKNHMAQSILMSFRVGCGVITTNNDKTIEEISSEYGIDTEELIRQLNFNRYY